MHVDYIQQFQLSSWLAQLSLVAIYTELAREYLAKW